MFSTSPKLLSRLAFVMALTVAIGVGTAFAQTPTAPAMPDAQEKDSIQDYLTNHPEQAKQLHENPSLINDPNWLAKNPKVANWMARNPGMKADAVTNPQAFVNRSEHSTLAHDHTALNETDRYMAAHPEMRKQLEANPKLIDDPKFLAAHPALDRELAKHPEIRSEAMNHPEAFEKAAEKNRKYNMSHPKNPHPAARPRAAKK